MVVHTIYVGKASHFSCVLCFNAEKGNESLASKYFWPHIKCMRNCNFFFGQALGFTLDWEELKVHNGT